MGQYDDIIHLKYHKNEARKQMSLHDRAAQFAPFAALKGYDEAVVETARLTDSKMILDENEIEQLDSILQYLFEHIKDKIEVSIVYFVPDERKSGGAYLDKIGIIKKFDKISKSIIFTDDTEILIDDIYNIAVNNSC